MAHVLKQLHLIFIFKDNCYILLKTRMHSNDPVMRVYILVNLGFLSLIKYDR